MLMKSVLRRSSLVVAALLASAVFSVARGAEPEVLKQVPGDAYGLVVVNHVRTLSNKLSNAATRMNLTLPPDLAGYFTRSMGITKGFDANSSAAVVLLKPTAERLAQGYFNGAPPAVMLLPTSDPKGMLEPFTPGEADAAGISEVKLPADPGQKGFVAIIDNKWIAFASSREDLQLYLGRKESFAEKAAPEIRKVFETNDLVIWGSVPKLGAGVDKWLEDAQTDLTGQMDLVNLANNLDPFTAALQRQSFNVGFAFMKQFLKDADSSMLTVRLTDSGATVGMIGDFRSDSPFGKFVASQKSAKPVSLAGLPSGNGGFLGTGAANWESQSMVTAMGNLMDAMMADEAITKDPRAADLKKSLELNKQLMAITSGMSFIALDPPAGGKTGYINRVVLFETSYPQKFCDIEMQGLKASLAQNSVNPDIKQTVTLTPDAITVKGVKLSKLNMKLTLREETPDKPVDSTSRFATNILQRIYGPDGLTAYFGVVGKRAIMIYGSDAGTLESAITTAENNTDALSSNATLVSMKDQLVANPIAVAYLPITRWMTLIQSAIRETPPGAQPTPVSPAIANAPPIVMSAGVSGSMMTAEIHVPIATISGVQDAYERLLRAISGATGGATP